jgi:hypothetical protein
MSQRLVRPLLVSLAAAAVLWFATAPAIGQGRGGGGGQGAAQQGGEIRTQEFESSGPAKPRPPAGPPPRTADGKPDLRGYWIAPPLRNSNILEEHAGGFGIQAGKSVVIDPPDGIIPYQPWALKQRDYNRRPEMNYEDNEGKCVLSGMPRIMLFSFRLNYSGDNILFQSDYIGATRVIRMKGPHVPAGIRLYMGDPVAKWEGDTLVVDITNFNGKFWFALGGDFAGDQMHMTERFRMLDANTLAWQATITDPKTFTRPWTMTAGPFERELTGRLEEEIEDSCHEGNADLDNLKRNYDKFKASEKASEGKR